MVVARYAEHVENRKKYHHGELRNALIAEGLKQLEVTGGDISLRAVAKAIGVSPNAPYRHFSERGDLMGALAASGFHRFADTVSAADDEADAMAALRKFGTAYLDFARHQPALYRLMFSPYGYSLDNAECRAEAERTFGTLLGVVDRARKSGWKPGHAAMPLALSYWALLHGWATLMADGLLPPGIAEPSWEELLSAYVA